MDAVAIWTWLLSFHPCLGSSYDAENSFQTTLHIMQRRFGLCNWRIRCKMIGGQKVLIANMLTKQNLTPRRLASRLRECLDAVTIEAFPGGKGFGGKAVVKGRHGFDSLHPLQRRAK
jgi:hypothetical protein